MLSRILLPLLLAVPAAAQTTWHVDHDAPDLPPPDGLSWDTPFRDLQEGIEAAEVGDLIKVAEGTYFPNQVFDRSVSFVLKEGLTIRGAYAGYGEPEPDLRDVDEYLTTLSGDLREDDWNDFWFDDRDDNSFHVVRMSLPLGGDAATLDGLTVRGGYADNQPFDEAGGGLLISDHASIVLLECRITDNFALISGGGLHGEEGSFRLEACLVDSNWVSCSGCGGLQNRGAGLSTQEGPLYIADSRFEGNVVGPALVDAVGGGLYAEDVTIDRCVFVDNTAESGPFGINGVGAGVYAVSATVNETEFTNNLATGVVDAQGGGMRAALPEITSCSFTGNAANADTDNAVGGGLMAGYGTVDRCQFSENWVSAGLVGRGGGLDFTEGIVKGCVFASNSAHGGLLGVGGGAATNGGADLSACSFFGNESELGGGLSIGGPGATVDDCVFSGNLVRGESAFGGAIYVSDFPMSTGSLSGCTVSSNTSEGSGGGVGVRGICWIRNGIFWGNRDTAAPSELSQIEYRNEFSPVKYSDIEFLGIVYGGGAGNIGEDPRFVLPAGVDGIPGTVDDDLRLLRNSPCKEAGHPAFILADRADIDGDHDFTEPSPLDCAYRRRPVHEVDMGAFEFPMDIPHQVELGHWPH